MLRDIVSISHALLKKLITYLDTYTLNQKGKILNDLVLADGSSQQKERIGSIIKRIANLENIYDIGLRATLPIEELIAIDFSHDLALNNYFYLN